MKRILVLLIISLFLLPAWSSTQSNPPSNLTATVDYSGRYPKVNLMWQQDSVNTWAKFNIYKKIGSLSDSNSRFIRIWSTHYRTFTDFYVQAGRTYSYYVTSVVNRVESAPSTMVEATVLAPVFTFGKISGLLVNDSANVPIGRGGVKFIPALNSAGNPIFVPTDSNGFFSARLRTGEYYMFSSAPGFVGEFYDNAATIQTATKVTVLENDSLILTVGLAKFVPPTFYTLTGRVDDYIYDAPHQKRAWVSAYLINRNFGHDLHRRKLQTTTDSLGFFSLTLKQNDTVVVYAFSSDRFLLPEFWNDKRTFAEADRIAITGNITDINMTLDPVPVYNNGITGTVSDSAGTLPLNAFIYAYKKVNNGIRYTKYYTQTDTASGGYTLSNMEPGAYILLSWARGYKSTYFRLDGTPTLNWREADTLVVSASDVIPNINFNLRPIRHRNSAGFVLGTVKQRAGNALDGALLYAVNTQGELVGCAVSDLDGSFEIEGLEKGDYFLVSNLMNYDDDYANDISISMENEVQQIDVVLNPNEVLSVGETPNVVTEYRLAQNYPNPFNPATVISYSLPVTGVVTLKVYNLLGNEVATLVQGMQEAGEKKVTFNASGLSSGVYMYKLSAGSFSEVKRMILIK
ncbi:MAG: T9SS type A sorting domain-containing protein [Ignavibacteriae bacterium]|nr:T9SS type A sorting domain-containing protein [Ignavibacteriota bacterium]